MNIRVTFDCLIKNVISEEGLEKDYGGDLSLCIKDLIENEGLFGITDPDDFELIDVERGDD